MTEWRQFHSLHEANSSSAEEADYSVLYSTSLLDTDGDPIDCDPATAIVMEAEWDEPVRHSTRPRVLRQQSHFPATRALSRRPTPRTPYSVIKRATDVLLSLTALVFLAPLMLLIAAALKLSERGPVFYSQPRIGRDGNTFMCHKFRTMRVDADAALAEVLRTDKRALRQWTTMHKLKPDPRVTGLGNFLRISSLDELPQFYNVLKGEMSLVGPRPIVAAERIRYGRYMREYEAMQPGITGLWQVSGRNRIAYRRRVAMDVLYSRRACVNVDLVILLKTLPAMIRAGGC